MLSLTYDVLSLLLRPPPLPCVPYFAPAELRPAPPLAFEPCASFTYDVLSLLLRPPPLPCVSYFAPAELRPAPPLAFELCALFNL